MKQLTFAKLTGCGFILSVTGAVTMFGLDFAFYRNDAILLTSLTLLLFYWIFLLAKSSNMTGGLTTTLGFIVVNLVLGISIRAYEPILIINLVALWLLRCCYFHRSFFSILVDGLLVFLGSSLAYLVLLMTQSWLLTFWCFFLTQAAFVFIPNQRPGNTNVGNPVYRNNDQQDFQAAYQSAETALEKLCDH